MEEDEAKDTMEQVAIRIMNKHNFIEMVSSTFGVVVLKDGVMIKLLHNFEVVSENWKLYRKAVYMEDKELIKEILTVNTDGGIIDTGDCIINILDIQVMYPIHRMAKMDEEKIKEEVKKEEWIREFYGDDFM